RYRPGTRLRPASPPFAVLGAAEQPSEGGRRADGERSLHQAAQQEHPDLPASQVHEQRAVRIPAPEERPGEVDAAEDDGVRGTRRLVVAAEVPQLAELRLRQPL